VREKHKDWIYREQSIKKTGNFSIDESFPDMVGGAGLEPSLAEKQKTVSSNNTE